MGIEELYAKIGSWLLLLEGYLEDKDIGNIFRMCRIKPYDIKGTEKFRNHWIDEFGNSIYIEDKRLRVVLNDLKISEDRKKTSDLYNGLSIGKVVKISKMIMISVEYIACLGIDKYLRAFWKIDGVWRKCSPLLLGIDRLRVMVDNADIEYAQEKNGDWLSVLPISKELVRKLDLEEIMNG
jgi:hypothetical protein